MIKRIVDGARGLAVEDPADLDGVLIAVVHA
jgi:hypothetical protein